jgi:hypothetical protein
VLFLFQSEIRNPKSIGWKLESGRYKAKKERLTAHGARLAVEGRWWKMAGVGFKV